MIELSIDFNTEFKTLKAIDLESTLFSGQSFRWFKSTDNDSIFTGIIGNNILLLRESRPGLIAASCSANTINNYGLEDFLTRYLSLDIDEKMAFRKSFQKKYNTVWKLVEPFIGVRVMRQDPFEIMVTFMCAQGIGMHLIRRQVSMIAERYGEKLVLHSESGTKIHYAFPSPKALASANPDELARCTNNNRIRATNIISMSRAFASGNQVFSCTGSGECSLDTLRESLCAHNGIGLKIADCIALFGLGRFDAFPIDTHVKQYLWEWFGIEAARHSLTVRNYRFLQEEARRILGNDLAGYAGHILFHCWRKVVKKMNAY